MKAMGICGILVIVVFNLSVAAAQAAPPAPQTGNPKDLSVQVAIPDKLPPPKKQEWVRRMLEVLALEKLALAQFEADYAKFRGQYTPYPNLITQETDHIKWIEGLFAAYGLPAQAQAPPLIPTATKEQAFEVGRKLEKDLFPKYRWLIKNAGDPTTKKVLKTILHQTEMHYLWFGGSPKDIPRKSR